MKYCSRCGTELVDEAVVCTKCGCAVGTAGQIVAGVSGIGQEFIIGLVGLILGVVGLIYSWVTMTSDVSSKTYEYISPLSGHEIMVIAIFIISTVVAIVCVFTFFNLEETQA
jgi:uncharacterized membrane protein YvbJ